MKAKKRCKDGKIRLTLTHREAVMLTEAMNNFTYGNKEALGVEYINIRLFDRDEFEDTEDWENLEYEMFCKLQDFLEDNYIVY